MGCRRVLIVFDNGIGNYILMTPAIQALRTVWPDSEFVLTLNPEWGEFTHEAIRFQASHLVDGFTMLGDWDYDEVFGTLWSAPRTYARGYTVPTMQYVPFKECQHESIYYFECVKSLGTDVYQPDVRVWMGCKELPVKDRKRIVICNDGRNELRRWKIYTKMAQVVRTLRKEMDAEFIAVGRHDGLEVDYDLDYREKLSFSQMVSVIAQSDLLLCNDTALMHAASALQKPTVAIFGATNEWKNGPLGGEVVHNGIECRPCFHTSSFTRCERRRCMNIDPDAVVNAVLGRL